MTTASPRPARRRPAAKSEPLYSVELVSITLYDVGRSIDLHKAAGLLPGVPGMRLLRRRDTPSSLSMPAPLCVDLRTGPQKAFTDETIEGLAVSARIYDEGVVSIILRLQVQASLRDLHSLAERRLSSSVSDLQSYQEERYATVLELLGPAITRDYTWQGSEQENYTAFCFGSIDQSPQQFLLDNQTALTTLLTGEPFDTVPHPSQVARTLSNPFSYSASDLAIFDMDRALIIDAQRDYEDVLLICELANYQFLELRVLDRLLDRWLDEAESDIQVFYGRRRQRKAVKRRIAKEQRAKAQPWLSNRRGSMKRRFAHLQALRLDALFILENIENSSKIIGDYFLGSLFEHLCGIFNTAGWTRSVERRLDALQHVYDIVRSDRNEQTMLFLEIVFIIVCIIPIIQFALG